MLAMGNTPRTSLPAPPAATRWDELERDLRMLCRSIQPREGWSPQAITTFVALPGDAEFAQAIDALCRRLADECGLWQSVEWRGGQWMIRFARPSGEAGLRRADYEFFGAYATPRLPRALARLREAARRVHGPRLRR